MQTRVYTPLETRQFVVFPFGHSETSKGTGGYKVLAEREDGKVYWSRAQALSARVIHAAGQPTFSLRGFPKVRLSVVEKETEAGFTRAGVTAMCFTVDSIIDPYH